MTAIGFGVTPNVDCSAAALRLLSLNCAGMTGNNRLLFSDAPFVMPSAITRFGGRIIRAERGFTVITTVLHTYFDNELAGKGDGLAALAARFPELTVDAPVR